MVKYLKRSDSLSIESDGGPSDGQDATDDRRPRDPGQGTLHATHRWMLRGIWRRTLLGMGALVFRGKTRKFQAKKRRFDSGKSWGVKSKIGGYSE